VEEQKPKLGSWRLDLKTFFKLRFSGAFLADTHGGKQNDGSKVEDK
jgi:hypothetical protein